MWRLLQFHYFQATVINCCRSIAQSSSRISQERKSSEAIKPSQLYKGGHECQTTFISSRPTDWRFWQKFETEGHCPWEHRYIFVHFECLITEPKCVRRSYKILMLEIIFCRVGKNQFLRFYKIWHSWDCRKTSSIPWWRP